MKSRTTVVILVSLALTGATATWALAGDEPAGKAEGEADSTAAAGGSMQGMMQALEKAAAPTEMHQLLAEMEGDWEVRVRMWMDPTAEPMESRGVTHNEMILGGRYLETRYKGDMMGKPFLGMGIEGYDPVSKTFTSLWMDTMGLAVMDQTGTCDTDDCKTRTYHGTWTDPVTGQRHERKSTLSQKSHTMVAVQMWDRVAGADQYNKTMELIYTKR